MFFIEKGRRGRAVVASCRSDQRAWEDDGLKRSIFSDVLLRALSTDSPVLDAQGQVDLSARLIPYLRDQVPIAASMLKRGYDQDPVTAGFLAGAIFLPAISSTSLGRPLTIPRAIRAGVRRVLIAAISTTVIGFAIADLLIFHLAVSSTGEVVVRPGFAATYSSLPIHLTSSLDTGVRISDLKPGDDSILASLAEGSIWGIATHRDPHGLRPWFAAVQPSLRPATLEPLRAFAFGEIPHLQADDEAPPDGPNRLLGAVIETARGLARIRHEA
jgi:hypothetical protein